MLLLYAWFVNPWLMKSVRQIIKWLFHYSINYENMMKVTYVSLNWVYCAVLANTRWLLNTLISHLTGSITTPAGCILSTRYLPLLFLNVKICYAIPKARFVYCIYEPYLLRSISVLIVPLRSSSPQLYVGAYDLYYCLSLLGLTGCRGMKRWP